MPDRGGARPPGGLRRRAGGYRVRSRLLLRSALAALLLSVLVVLASGIWAGRLWYDSVGYSSVYTTRMVTEAWLFAGFGLAAAVVVGLNAWLAHRLRSPLSAMSEEQQSLERYREAIGCRRARALFGVALTSGLIAGLTATGAWQTWLGYAHRTRFGTVDPQFHRDVSFYVFELPWYRFLVDFGFTVLVAALAVSALVHYLYGGIRTQAFSGRRLSRAARAHLGVLLGLFLLTKAAAYWLDRYALVLRGESFKGEQGWTGLRFVDATAVLPAKSILCCVALICAVLFLVTPLRRNWTLPVVGLVLMALSSVLIGAVYPAIVQQFQVRADEKGKERPFVQRNITATRAAYAVAGTTVSGYEAAGTPDSALAAGDAAALADLRLPAADAADPELAQLPAASVRYSTDATDGTVLGESGQGGVALDGPLARFAYAVTFDRPGLMFRTGSGAGSSLLYERTPQERVQAVAPWLTVDGDPYPVRVDGRVLWVVDGYTTSDDYPYATRSNLGGSGPGAEQVNYARDAVKATVDVSSGAVTLYQWDRTDPLLSTWMKAFPGTVRPYAGIGAALLAQLRYPSDLFLLQQEILRSYHVTDPAVFVDGTEAWDVPSAQSPAYLSLRTPGQRTAAPKLTGSFVHGADQRAVAVMLVDAAAGPGYGTIRILDLPTAQVSPGRAEVQSALRRNAVAAGADVDYGELLTLPVGGGLLYLEPVYRRGGGADRSRPEQVLAMFGTRTAAATDLPGALSAVLGGGSDSGPVAADLRAAQQAYQDAQAHLRSGDLSGYARDRTRLEAALTGALAAERGGR